MDPFYIALLLYVLAIVLAFVDLFIPSGGMLLIMAVLSAFASILFGFQSSTNMGLGILALVLASIPAFAFAAIKIWPKTPIGKRIILKTPGQAESPKRVVELRDFVGHVLEAQYPLMPSGQIKIGTKRLNAVARSGLIEVGERIEVIDTRERNLVVQKTSKPLTSTLGPNENPAENGGQEGIEDSPRREDSNLLDLPADELGLDSID